MFLLDTNVAIAALNETDITLAARLDGEFAKGTAIAMSSIVLFELEFGAAKSARPAQNRIRLAKFLTLPFIRAPFEPEDAQHAGAIRAVLARAGTPIRPYDLLIAAQARRLGATLVMANRREFDRVGGLSVEDWATGP